MSSQLLPPKYSLLRYLSTVLNFGATYSQTLKTSLNKSQEKDHNLNQSSLTVFILGLVE